METRRRAWPWWLGGIAGAIALPFLLLHFLPQSGASVRIEALRKLGYPTTLKELADWQPPVADADNINVVVLEAAASLRAAGDGKAGSRIERDGEIFRGEPWPDDVKKDAVDFVARNHEAFEKIPEILRRKEGWTRIAYANGFNALLPHLADFKRVAQAFDKKAGLDAEEKRPHDAVLAIQAAFATAHGLDREPTLISQLVRIAVDSIACGTIDRVLNRVEVDEADLVALQQTVAARSDLKSLSVGLAGEFCFGSDAFSRGPAYLVSLGGLSGNNSGNNPGAAVAIWLYSASGLLRQDRACYVEMLSDFIQIARREPWERFEAADAWEQRIIQLKSEWYKGHIMTSMLLPALVKTVAKEARCMAQLRCTATGIALERYRKAHNGQYPDSLDALVPAFMPAVPLDPFDGKPLRFAKRPTGYVVYSLGPDRDDDRGREHVKGRSGEDFDITFIVER